jgi:hypothetical protein
MTGQPISPELALIDPALARALRRSLPEPGCFQPGYASPKPATQRAHTIPPLSDNAQPPRGRRRAIVGAAATVVAAATAILLAIALTSSTDTTTILATPTVETRAAAPPAARHDSAGNTWPAVPGAYGYSVALARDGALVYQATTRDTTLRLPAGLHLAPGSYTWTVIPRSNHPTSEQPHRPLVATTFTVPAG